MIRFIKTYSKQFKKQWLIHTLSILGLSIGMSVALLLGWWSINEFSFDNFIKDGDRVYRVGREGYINNETVKIASCFAPLARESKSNFPEIESSMKVVFRSQVELNVDDKSVFKTVIIADSNFFDILNYPIIEGNLEQCMNKPNAIVISENLALNLFFGENAIGQIINYNDTPKEVMAILRDIPANSHLQFDAILPMSDFDHINNRPWLSNDEYMTYFKLYEGVDVEDLAAKITLLTQEQAPVLKEIPIHHFIQPLGDIHFGSTNFRFDRAVSGNMDLVLVLLFMGIIILVIACINFTNLFISTAFLRAKSLAIKKTNGAEQWHLIRDFYLETTFSVFIALVLGVLMAVIALPMFNTLSQSSIEFSMSDLRLHILILGTAFLTIIFAGTVPAFSMSRMDLIESLKGGIKGRSVSLFQKALIILQFTASIILLTVVFGIQKQIIFMKNFDLGFDTEQVVYIQANEGFSENYEAVKAELERNSAIIQVTAKNSLPMNWNNGNAVSVPGFSDDPYIMEICYAKSNYFNMMDMAIVDGERMEDRHEGKNYVWLNEQAVKVLGLTDPIGKQVQLDELMEVKGVVENVKTKSLHLNIDPQVYIADNRVPDYYSVMIKTSGDDENAITKLKELWEKYNPEVDFDYGFLDQAYANLYQSEERAGKIVGLGMIVAIILTIIGTFAMATYAAERRTKEIGIRKVNGAKVIEILILLNKDFFIFILIAFVLAIPVAFYFMTNWLESFAFRTTMTWWLFGMSGLVVILISLVTISWRSFRAARKNPVKALRYE